MVPRLQVGVDANEGRQEVVPEVRQPNAYGAVPLVRLRCEDGVWEVVAPNPTGQNEVGDGHLLNSGQGAKHHSARAWWVHERGWLHPLSSRLVVKNFATKRQSLLGKLWWVVLLSLLEFQEVLEVFGDSGSVEGQRKIKRHRLGSRCRHHPAPASVMVLDNTIIADSQEVAQTAEGLDEVTLSGPAPADQDGHRVKIDRYIRQALVVRDVDVLDHAVACGLFASVVAPCALYGGTGLKRYSAFLPNTSRKPRRCSASSFFSRSAWTCS